MEDNGPGLSDDELDHVFQRFWRASEQPGGCGLGLAIVKHVAQRHGGQVDVQSTLGQGSTFMIHLPASRIRQRSIA